MPERDNDRLEGFFKKVAGRPEISFREEDWKKLEARLDAQGTRLKKARNRITGAVVLAVLLVGSVYWLGHVSEKPYDVAKVEQEGVSTNKVPEAMESEPINSNSEVAGFESKDAEVVQERVSLRKRSIEQKVQVVGVEKESNQQPLIADKMLLSPGIRAERNSTSDQSLSNDVAKEELYSNVETPGLNEAVGEVDNHKIPVELSQTSPAFADKIKQKAGTELPDAEEKGEDAIVKEEFASDQMKHMASPRLSLLLSLAPDFSSTSFNEYGDPGEAFGIMVHYHIKNKWSISTGMVRSHKKYTGSGEDYTPPKGYWKYYTNGVIPNTVDGSCNVLEIPVMVQYTLAMAGKNKFLVGGGVSSYIMLDESYRYNFEQPNPGAKDGWDSKHSSTCLLNMINLTVGYERQILPGLLLGVEPYLKIPMEGIGWSNLKLFSTGASLTLRYNVLKKGHPTLPTRSRSPD